MNNKSDNVSLFTVLVGVFVFEGVTHRGSSGVNFINIILTNISYERRFPSYVLALLKNLYKKRASITLMKLTTGVLTIFRTLCNATIYIQ